MQVSTAGYLFQVAPCYPTPNSEKSGRTGLTTHPGEDPNGSDPRGRWKGIGLCSLLQKKLKYKMVSAHSDGKKLKKNKKNFVQKIICAIFAYT